MANKILKPVEVDKNAVDKLEAMILRLLFRELYSPLLDVIPALDKKTISNSKADLVKAIRSGKITFNRGKFIGTFNAQVSRELRNLGAKWDRKDSSFKINLNSLPQDIQASIRTSETAFTSTMTAFNRQLSQILPENIARKARFERFFDTQVFKLDGKLKKQIEGITVAPQLTDAAKEQIAREYSDNLERYITKFTEKQIATLRKDIQKSVYAGNRYESLVDSIQKNYGVSESKAKFLARQETNLLSAKYRESRYVDAGSKGYYWRCVKGSPKHPVRPDHKLLDGEFILWNNPPVVDQKTGRRAHAGEDFNCRCTPRIVLRVDEKNK